MDRAWFCVCGMVYLYFLCFVMSYLVTLSLIVIEGSPFALALISRILIYSQAATLLLANDRVGVGIPSLTSNEKSSTKIVLLTQVSESLIPPLIQ